MEEGTVEQRSEWSKGQKYGIGASYEGADGEGGWVWACMEEGGGKVVGLEESEAGEYGWRLMIAFYYLFPMVKLA